MSTYLNANYLYVAHAFAEPTLAAIQSADPRNPGVRPRPALGIEFVSIPEFAALGDQASQSLSAAIGGQGDAASVLSRARQQAEPVGAKYRGRG